MMRDPRLCCAAAFAMMRSKERAIALALSRKTGLGVSTVSGLDADRFGMC